MVHACCFHTGSASFCVDGRNDSTIFSPCQPFSRKKLVRTCGRRERPPALCALWAWSPLARCCCARAAAVRAAARAVRIMGLVAARLRAGPIPTLRSLWHGPPLRRTQAALALRATAGSKKRGMPHPAAYFAGPCARTSRRAVRRARPLPPRQARLRAHRSRRGCAPAPVPPHASVSSARRAQETRHVPPPRSLRRSNRPHQPSEVWRAAALQVKSYRPAPPGGRGVCAPRRKHSLHVSPAAPKAQGKRAPPGGKDRQRRAFPTPAVRRGFSDAPIAVCRSSPRCPR